MKSSATDSLGPAGVEVEETWIVDLVVGVVGDDVVSVADGVAVDVVADSDSSSV